MTIHPVSDEVAATLGGFFTGGNGPRHSVLTRVFTRSGYGNAAPYEPQSQTMQPNKEDRVRDTVMAAVKHPHRSRELVDALLSEMRADGCFSAGDDPMMERRRQERVRALQAAFALVDWELTEDGLLRSGAVIALRSATDRPALDEQLARLRRAADDPGLLLGTAKEMLESTAKYVLEEFSVPYSPSIDFDQLWYLARDRLGLNPKDIDASQPGGEHVRQILQSAWAIARSTNDLRKLQGTGHGRTLPTGVSAEMALMVVGEACSVAQLVLGTLDRHLGR